MRIYKKGISLVSLLITIIVIMILLTTVIISLKDQHITDAALEVRLKEKIESYRTDIEDYVSKKEIEEGIYYNKLLLYADRNSIVYDSNTVDGNIFSILNSMTEEDSKIFKISEGSLVYAPETEDFDKDEFEIATKAGLISYIKSGLVGYYEGTNNAGTSHSSSAIKWKDLSLKNNDGIVSKKNNDCWGEEAFITDGESSSVSFPIKIASESDFTIEVVYKDSGSGDLLLTVNGSVELSKISASSSTGKLYKVAFVYDSSADVIYKYGIDGSRLQNQSVSKALSSGVSFIEIPKKSNNEYYVIRIYDRNIVKELSTNTSIDSLRFEDIN